MGNPRSCSFNIGRGPRSTTWGTWRTSTPPGWAKTPSGLHRTELSAVEASLRDNHGLDQDRVGHHGIHLHQPPRILTPPTTRTHTLEGEFSSSHIRFLLLLSIMSTFSVESTLPFLLPPIQLSKIYRRHYWRHLTRTTTRSGTISSGL